MREVIIDLARIVTEQRREIEALRAVAWSAAEVLQDIHEKPEYAASPVIMNIMVNAMLGDAQKAHDESFVNARGSGGESDG